jgi:hypothetical protein
MPEETIPSNDQRLAGALWLMAGVACAGLLIIVFVGERILLVNPGLSALVLGGAIAALLMGALLLARPAPRVVVWSSVLGAAWLIAFGYLLVGAIGDADPDGGPLFSLSLITALGIAGAVAALWSRMLGRRLG